MCNNGFCGGNMCWIIILILLLCNCGGSYGNDARCGNCGSSCC